MPSTTANSLISLRLPELTDVAERSVNRAASSAVVALTCRLAAGEEEAFRQFQELYFDRLYRFLLVVARGHETQAREALQETFVRVARHAKRFEDEEGFYQRWLATIGRNAARDAGSQPDPLRRPAGTVYACPASLDVPRLKRAKGR